MTYTTFTVVKSNSIFDKLFPKSFSFKKINTLSTYSLIYTWTSFYENLHNFTCQIPNTGKYKFKIRISMQWSVTMKQISEWKEHFLQSHNKEGTINPDHKEWEFWLSCLMFSFPLFLFLFLSLNPSGKIYQNQCSSDGPYLMMKLM